MGVLSAVTLPWRVAAASVEVVFAARDLLAPDGPLQRAAVHAERLDALLARNGPLEQLVGPGGPVDQIAELLATTTRLVSALQSLPAISGQLGAIESQVGSLGSALSRLEPMLDGLQSSVTTLQDSAHVLGQSVEPLGRLADRLPGGRRRGGPADVAGSRGATVIEASASPAVIEPL